jgi:predicted nucleotide-binding protein
MEKTKEQLRLLFEKGNRFTYDNFSEKGKHGYTSSFTPEWIAWQIKVKSVIEKLFGKNSSQSQAIEDALAIPIRGYGINKFKQCRSYIIGVLQVAIETSKDDVFGELQSDSAIAPGKLSNKVFVVHGHDEVAKSDLEIILREIGLDPIVLHRKADQGQTIIEKFEKHADVGYALILLTPDEVSYLKKYDACSDDERVKELRARPNVIFEFGYFVGRLGRSKVCCLYTGDVALPTDVSGMIYKPYSANVKEVAYDIIKDLKASGYQLNMHKITEVV